MKDANQVFSHALVVFPLLGYKWLSLLQSTIHEVWARHCSSSFGNALRYNPSDAFETFPLPNNFVNQDINNEINKMEQLGKKLHEYREEFMQRNNFGLTTTYNLINDPRVNSEDILFLRSLHCQIDKEVLNEYGWGDICPEYGFSIENIDIDDEIQLTPKLLEYSKKEELFFSSISEINILENEIENVTGNKNKLNWKYGWRNSLREDLLARLLALNIIRHNEELAKFTNSSSKVIKNKKKSNLINNFQIDLDF